MPSHHSSSSYDWGTTQEDPVVPDCCESEGQRGHTTRPTCVLFLRLHPSVFAFSLISWLSPSKSCVWLERGWSMFLQCGETIFFSFYVDKTQLNLPSNSSVRTLLLFTTTVITHIHFSQSHPIPSHHLHNVKIPHCLECWECWIWLQASRFFVWAVPGWNANQ